MLLIGVANRAWTVYISARPLPRLDLSEARTTSVGRLRAWYRRKVGTPAAFGHRHLQPWGILSIPTRIQAIFVRRPQGRQAAWHPRPSSRSRPGHERPTSRADTRYSSSSRSTSCGAVSATALSRTTCCAYRQVLESGLMVATSGRGIDSWRAMLPIGRG